MLSNGDDDQQISIETGDLCHHVKLNEGFTCLSIRGILTEFSINRVLNTVRNRLLDFALALEKEYPDFTKSGVVDVPVSNEKVTNIFYNTIHGGSPQIVGGAENSTFTVSVIKNDIESLRSVLGSMGVADFDIEELSTAVQDETGPVEGSLGPKVLAWIGKMSEKAATGAVTVSSTLLVQKLLEYYGLSPTQ